MKHNYTKKKLEVLRSCLLAILFLQFAGFIHGQQTYTFIPCGATGSVGPTQTQVGLAYSSTNLSGSVTVIGNGIQTWTVPHSGLYKIEARGAQGGSGGLGAKMIGDFNLTAGEVIRILVGQMGELGGSGPDGGGGGSFVIRTPYNTGASILVIAGGGSGNGTYSFTPGVHTPAGVTGGVAGGINGSGGGGGIRGAGGGGFFTDGGPCTINTIYASPGQSFVNGGLGGPRTNNITCNFTASGGFGGGSSHGGNCITNGGAGGGYSGGGGSSNTTSGGGGSLNQGTNQINSSDSNAGDGKVIIKDLCSIGIIAPGSNSVSTTLCSGNSLTLTTTAVSGYSWNTGQTTSSIVVAPTTNTVYSLTGTSSLACTAIGIMSVTVSSAVPVLSISNPNNNICPGRVVTLTASGALTYTWSNANIINGQAFTPGSTSGYTVTGQNGCGQSTASTTITVTPLTISVSSSSNQICSGSTVALIANAAVAGFTWMPANITGSNVIAAPLINTVYTLTASDGTCSGSATLALTTKPLPTLAVIASATNICEGALVTMTVSGAASYTWFPITSNASVVSDNPITPTSYAVSGTSALNCTAATSQIVVTKPNPVILISATKTLVCVAATASLTASGANSYVWTNGPSAASYVVNLSVNTTYTVTGTSTNGCSANKTITVNVLTVSVTLTAATSSICEGDNTVLHANGATTYTFVGAINFNGNATVSPSVTTVYTVNANTTSPGLSCPSSNTISITVFSLPTLSVSATKTVMCRKDANVVIKAIGATSYTWLTAQLTNTISVGPQSTTVYSVTGTDAHGCQDGAFIQIVVNSCTGIEKSYLEGTPLVIYPNPNNGTFILKSDLAVDLILVNELGQHLKSIKLEETNNFSFEFKDLKPGVYFIVNPKGPETKAQKIVVN